MATANNERSIKVSQKTHETLEDIATQRYGNPDAVTWSGLIYELCNEQGEANHE